MVSSTPKPGNCREEIKLTFDQATQTEEARPTVEAPEVEGNPAQFALMEDLVKKLYRQFTSLISNLEREESVASMQSDSYVDSDTESSIGRVATPQQPLPAIVERGETPQHSSNESGTEHVISTSNIRAEAGPSRPKTLKVRRVSAHTTNTLDLSRSNDMVCYTIEIK